MLKKNRGAIRMDNPLGTRHNKDKQNKKHNTEN